MADTVNQPTNQAPAPIAPIPAGKTPEQLRAEQAARGEPLKSGAAAQASIDPPREMPASDRVRAFEDEHVGKDAVRIGGRIERGSGSPFAALSPEKKRQYAALEKLVVAEQKLADAHAALVQAEADHEAALAAAEPKPDGKGPTVEEWVAAGYQAINYPPSGYESRSTQEEIDAAIAKQKADAKTE